MDCERFDKIALSLLYEETDEISAASARRHLHHCSRCQGIYSQLRATREVTEIPFEPAPPDLFESVLDAERKAQSELPVSERLSRVVSILAGYAMRPQLAMAALLLLMIGSSLLFVRNDPSERDKVRVTELGAPHKSQTTAPRSSAEPQVFSGDTTDRGSPMPTPGASLAEPKATYREALSAYHDGRYAEAERLFSEVARAGGEKAAAAALHQGHAARNGSGCQRASGIYDDVTEQYRGTTISDEASWHAASCYQAMGQLARAKSHYERLRLSSAFGARAEKSLASVAEQEREQREAKAELAARTSSGESTPRDSEPTSPAATSAPAVPEATGSVNASSDPLAVAARARSVERKAKAAASETSDAERGSEGDAAPPAETPASAPSKAKPIPPAQGSGQQSSP